MWESTQTVWLLRQRQGRGAHRERLWVSPSEEASFIGKLFQVFFFYLWPIIWFLFHTWPALGPSLIRSHNFFPRWISAQRPMESHMLGFAPPFYPPGVFLSMWNVSLAPWRGYTWPLDPLLKQCLAPLCSCHDCYLKVSIGDKVWLFTLFQLLFPFWRANRRLVVNV